MPRQKKETEEIKKTKTKITTKKRTRKKKLSKKEINNEFLLIAFLLATTSILATALNSYHFPFMGFNISFAVILLPVIIFVSNYITKKFGFKDSFKSIIISSLIIVAFIILIDDIVGKQIDLLQLFGQVLGYFVSMFLNLFIYYYVISNMEIKKEAVLIYFSYIFSMLTNHIIYMLFTRNMIVTTDFWNIYFISIIIEAIISIVLVYFDSKIKRGIEE